MRSSAALKQLRLIASQGLPSHQSIPLMLAEIEQLIPCSFANFFWLDERGMPTDSYLPVVIPSAMDAFIGNQRRLIEDPAEPSIDKYVRLGPRVGASRSLGIDQARFDRSILYNEVYRPYGIEDALNFVIRERGRPLGIVLVNREVRPGRWTRPKPICC